MYTEPDWEAQMKIPVKCVPFLTAHDRRLVPAQAAVSVAIEFSERVS
jgi:hypothetical protein